MPVDLFSRDADAPAESVGLLPEEAAEHWQPLPEYAELLTARHRLHRDTFETIIGDLPIDPGDQVLDVAIGDGLYTQLLADRVPNGTALGLDVSPEFLQLADDVFVHHPAAGLIAGDAVSLPLEDDCCDLVWCAHSLRSLPDAEAAVREWARVVRPGGHIAVLENDRLHDLILPWPPEVELALYRADCQTDEHDMDRPLGGLHSGRRLHRLAAACDLEWVGKTTYTIDTAPPTDEDRAYLKLMLADLLGRVGGKVDDADELAVRRWCDPAGERYLPAEKTLEMTFIDHVGLMRKPMHEPTQGQA